MFIRKASLRGKLPPTPWARLLTSAAVIGSVLFASSPAAYASANHPEAVPSEITIGMPGFPGLWMGRSWWLAGNILPSLVTRGLLGIDENGKLFPELASSWKAVTPTKYVYTLRPGAKFSDGNPVTAQDVAWSYNLMKNPANATALVSFFTNVSSITAVGSNQVVVTLKKPDIQWQYTVAHLAGMVYEKSSYKGNPDQFGTSSDIPIGSGPYMYSQDVPNTRIVVTRNPYWYGPKPPFDKITFVQIPDDQTRVLALESGQIDGTFFVPVPAIPTLQHAGLQTRIWPNNGFAGLTLDVTDPPFNNIHVRKAIAYAVDRAGLVQATYAGQSEPLSALNPPQAFLPYLSQSVITKAYSAIPSYTFNLAKAKQELAQSPVPHGFSLTLNIPPAGAPPYLVNLYESVQQTLGEIGIHVTLKSGGSGWFNLILDHGKDLGMQLMSSPPDLPTPVSFVYQWLDGVNATKGGQNSSNYRNPVVNQLINNALSSTNPQATALDVLNVEKIAAQDVAVVPAIAQTWIAAFRKPFVLNRLGPFYNFGSWVYDIVPR